MKNLLLLLFPFIIYSCDSHSTKSAKNVPAFDSVALFKHNASEVGLCYDTTDTAKEKSIVMDWVNKDVGIIENIFNRLPEKCANLDSVQTLIPNLFSNRGNGSLEQEDLGNETKWYRYKMYGGYSSFNFEFITYQSKVLRMNEYISTHSELSQPYFLPKIKVNIFCNGTSIEHIYLNQNAIALYKKTYSHSLIDSLIFHPANEEEEIFSFFTNYSRNRSLLIYPRNVWGENLSPLYKNMAYLIDHEKYNTIENLVFSPLPEGRIFAAAALDYLITNKKISAPIRPDIIAEMEKIKTTDREIISQQLNSHYYELTDFIKHDIFEEFVGGYLAFREAK